MNERPKRIKLENFEINNTLDDRCTSRVVLSWNPDDPVVGTATAEDSDRGRLRSSAEATARALEVASDGKVGLDILAIKEIEGFDTVLVIVSLSCDVMRTTERLSGSCLIRGQVTGRSAAMAVLDATNRLYGSAVRGLLNQQASVLH